MILITGAAGKTGRAIVQKLKILNYSIRTFVRNSNQSDLLSRLGLSDNFIGDLSNPEDLIKAMSGISQIYHICPNMHPEEEEIGKHIIDAAMMHGIQHFVYHSVLHPQIESMPHHWNKMRVEEYLIGSGIPFTILQPAAYMQNILAGWTLIIKDGVYRAPYNENARLAMVDITDVADAVLVILTQPGHINATYQLCSPDNLSQKEMANILTEVTSKQVQFEEIERNEWSKNASESGMNNYALDTLLKMFNYYDQHNFPGNPNHLGWLIGHPPTLFIDFIRHYHNTHAHGSPLFITS